MARPFEGRPEQLAARFENSGGAGRRRRRNRLRLARRLRSQHCADDHDEADWEDCFHHRFFRSGRARNARTVSVIRRNRVSGFLACSMASAYSRW